MRRKDREIKDTEDIINIVSRAKILHLGLLDEVYPYIVPLHYGYEFTDGKSRILAEIDDKIWQGLVVTPNDFVEIEGYIDNDPFERTEIEVYRIIKLK